MVSVRSIRVDGGRLRKDARYRLCGSKTPEFSWAVFSDRPGGKQKSCRVVVQKGEKILWDSGEVYTENQRLMYGGSMLPTGERLKISVTVQSAAGERSLPCEETFYRADTDWTAFWIAPREDMGRSAVYFRREFDVKKPVRSACAYICGLGYHRLYINGAEADISRLDPAHSDYTKSCYYAVLPEAAGLLRAGTNCIGVTIAEGWRRNDGPFIRHHTEKVNFFGIPQLSMMLDINYGDGTSERIVTGEDWLCGGGAVTETNLFDGETYDAGADRPGWNLPGTDPDFVPAALVPPPGGVMRPQLLEPIRVGKSYEPLTVTSMRSGVFIVDFGQNIAGVVRLRLPKMKAGQRVTIRHAELLEEDGTLCTAPLRGAKAEDSYVASGDARDLDCFEPCFTYHGFRYAQVEGLLDLKKEDIRALSLHTDLECGSFFRCGDALVNAVQQNIVQTERANMHGILTDCPQRDERMGWLNDATVRFEETPYNFDIGRMFPKIIRDILDVQDPDGSITCTAPRVYGQRPADPVCSSFLVAALQSYLHTGDLTALREGYKGFCAWEECLLNHSTDYIVNYSYYGDWAGPAYACEGEDGAVSAVTPGVFMSTGYSFYNAVSLTRFAALLGREQDRVKYVGIAENIRSAMLKKWYDPKSGRVATGSQACQAFALWLDLLPEQGRKKAAALLHDDLVSRDYRFTTGNLCTRYLLDVLCRYGYTDDAWRIMTRQQYPSFGFMIQNGATTIWERFEMKKNPGMNSHSHPMYGAAGSFLYAYIAGMVPTGPGWSRFTVRPYMPNELLSAEACVDTPLGDAAVRWTRRYGKTQLYVTVPFGAEAEVIMPDGTVTVGGGFHTFGWAQ